MKPSDITSTPLPHACPFWAGHSYKAQAQKVAVAVLAVACCGVLPARSATINLAAPVSDSVATITGINWKFDSVTGATTPDSSGNGLTGVLDGTPTPVLVGGVNLAGTSGYDDGIRLNTANLNRVYVNTDGVKLAMAGTSFTGGAWLSFNSLLPGEQLVMIMDRGGWELDPAQYGGGWAYFLQKDASGNWRMGFTARDNTASTTIYSSDSFSDLDISLDEWIHFGFSFQAGESTDPNTVTFWLNGKIVNAVSIARDITAGTQTANGWRFSAGQRGVSTPGSFDGTMDDLFVTTGVYDFGAIPVPEPSTTGLIFLGGAVVLFLRQRYRSPRSHSIV